MSVPPHLLQDGRPDYLKMILTSRVYDVCKETPCQRGASLSERLGTNIYIKREDMQPVFSFKLRGAYNMMAQIDPSLRWKGVISCSAGNHAQGVAYSARHLGIPATIVMPLATPAIKHENVRRLGADVVLFGDNFDEAKAECARLQAVHGMTFIPPFDDPFVIAGQGTIGLELLRQLDISKLKAIFCCVGGGGLIAGIAAYVKRIAPHVKIIGVETYDADAMTQSIAADKMVTLDDVGLFADGAAVKVVGSECWTVAHGLIDEMVHVNTDEICAAINDIFNDTRAITEPAGALSVAGVKKYLERHPDLRDDANQFAAVLSGANMNFDRLRFVAERSRLGAGKEVFFVVEMAETPGSFRALISLLDGKAITEFSYRHTNDSATNAVVYISFSTDDRSEIPVLLSSIEGIGMSAWDVSDNNLAKDHIRYMVGGHARLEDEHIYRFEFPEKPGALKRFLNGMEMSWNISLFHYRNNGSDIGSVLAGIQTSNLEGLDKFLRELGYKHTSEDENPAYKLFLK